MLEVHKALRTQVLQLQIRWAQFTFLFTVSDKRMVVLSNVAPGFFEIIKEVLRDDAFIALSRLTDKSSTFGHQNLSLVTLVELAEASGNTELATKASSLLDALRARVEAIRAWRDKWLAHTDLAEAKLDKPLEHAKVQRGHVDEAITLVLQLMRLFAEHLGEVPLGSELPIVVGDADVLARFLEGA